MSAKHRQFINARGPLLAKVLAKNPKPSARVDTSVREQRMYLLLELNRHKGYKLHVEVKEPAGIVAARKLLKKWDRENDNANERRRLAFSKDRDALKEFIIFNPPVKARAKLAAFTKKWAKAKE